MRLPSGYSRLSRLSISVGTSQWFVYVLPKGLIGTSYNTHTQLNNNSSTAHGGGGGEIREARVKAREVRERQRRIDMISVVMKPISRLVWVNT
jgi:hypothetical protein